MTADEPEDVQRSEPAPVQLAKPVAMSRRHGLRGLELAGLGLVLGCAFALRVVGAATDYPWCWYPDRDVVIHARNCINPRSPKLDPGEYIYPTGYIYLNALVYAAAGAGALVTGAVHGLHGLAELYYGKVGFLAALTRGLGSTLAVVGVLLVAGLGRSLAGKAAGAFAALALTFAGLDIICCHYPTTDAPAAVALLACSVWALKLYRSGGTAKDYLLGGALAGAAAAVKYPAGAGLVGMALAVLLARRSAAAGPALRDADEGAGAASGAPEQAPEGPSGDTQGTGPEHQRATQVTRPVPRWAALGLLIVGAGAAFVVLMPWAVLNWPVFLADLFYQAVYNRTGPEAAWQLGRFFFRATPAAGVGWPLNLVALGGLALLAWQRKREAAVVLAGPLLVYLSFVSTTRFVPRWYEMLVPFVALGIGLGFAWAAEALPVRRGLALGLAATVLGLLLVGPARLAAQYDRLLLERGSRALATEWVEQNIPPGSSVALTQWLWAGPDVPPEKYRVQWVLPGSPERLYAGLKLKWILDDDLGAALKSWRPEAYARLRERQERWLSRGTSMQDLLPDYRLQTEWVVVNADHLASAAKHTARGWAPVPGQAPLPYFGPLLSRWQQQLNQYLSHNYEVAFATPALGPRHPWGLAPYGSPQILIYRRCTPAEGPADDLSGGQVEPSAEDAAAIRDPVQRN